MMWNIQERNRTGVPGISPMEDPWEREGGSTSGINIKKGGGGSIDVLISLHKTLKTRAFPTEGSQERAKKLALIRNDLE